MKQGDGLISLAVRDFAIIDSLDLAFAPGLAVFTGETGAGKSIVLDALSFLLGERAAASTIRTGAAKMAVEGRFRRAGREVLVRRELESTGKGRAWIDGKGVPVSALAAFGEGLIDFHGQHEHQSLFKPAVQLELLDGFGGLAKKREAVAAAYAAYARAKADLETSQMSEQERTRLVDLYRWQLEEIDKVSPKAGEEEELESRLPRLKDAEKLRALAQEATRQLREEDGAAAERLSKAERALEELARLDAAMAPWLEEARSARIKAEETARELAAYADGLEADPEALDALITRQDRIAKLRKKYGPELADVLAHREKAAAELARLERFDADRSDLEKALAASEKAYRKAAAALHKDRMDAAKRLSAALTRELQGLGMPGARFEAALEFDEERASADGSDQAEFLIAANPGEPARPLRAVASGGELSRTMLALKGVLADGDKVPVLVFDEVDAGVGGAAARTVGEKLAALARRRQVLCVTHLAQVASHGDLHFRVWKEQARGRTAVRTQLLEGDGRREEVARMMSGKTTASTLQAAAELLAAGSGR